MAPKASAPGQAASDSEVLYIHQYSPSSARVTLAQEELTLVQDTCYPWDGAVQITLHAKKALNTTIALRIPGWCREFELFVNGSVSKASYSNGYAALLRQWQDGDVITLKLSMPVTMLHGNPRVVETAGRVALRRGPVIYCLEGIDQPEYNIFDMSLPSKTQEFAQKHMDICGHPVTAITGSAFMAQSEH